MNRYNNVQLDGKPMKIDLVGTNLMALPERTTYGSTLFGGGQPSLLMKYVSRVKSNAFQSITGVLRLGNIELEYHIYR